jgi:hypothetical protein
VSFINVDVQGEAEWQRRMAVLASLPGRQMGVVEVMNSELEGMMGESRHLCPVVSGTLRSSATVEPAQISGEEISQTAGYGGAAKKYARKVHENPRAGKTGGVSPKGRKYYPRPGLPVPYSTVGQWKFLEQPFLARRARMLAAIAAAVQRATEAVARG